MILGIDPGWASCGLALHHQAELLQYGHFVPRDQTKIDSLQGPISYVHAWCETIDRRVKDFEGVYMERYVAYKGIQSEMSEYILMYIGALKGFFNCKGIKVNMVRAIDWKPEICKYLVRTQGFKNPSQSFDKKYSIAAATALSGKEFKTDHEADAVCLSYLGEVEKYNKERKAK